MGGKGHQLCGCNGQRDVMDCETAAREWVERTCAEQGLQVKISDAGTVIRVAAILVEGLDAPDRTKARRIDSLKSPLRWADDNMVQDGGDNGASLVQVKVSPSAP